MSVEVAVRLVDERNSSRNWSPTPSPVGIRLQLSSTSTGGSGSSLSVMVPLALDGAPRAASVGLLRVSVNVSWSASSALSSLVAMLMMLDVSPGGMAMVPLVIWKSLPPTAVGLLLAVSSASTEVLYRTVTVSVKALLRVTWNSTGEPSVAVASWMVMDSATW